MSWVRQIGWWLLSQENRVYGPVSAATLERFLREGVISRETLARHCLEPDWRPVAEIEGPWDPAALDAAPLLAGDRLAEHWPRRRSKQEALGAADIPCARHRRPAILVCARCLAPYCRKCRLRAKNPLYNCRRCQEGLILRRFVALTIDQVLMTVVAFLIGAGAGIYAVFLERRGAELAAVRIEAAAQILSFILHMVYMMFRDAAMGGAGPGKRLLGIRVVQQRDPTRPLTYGQGFIRWLGMLLWTLPFAAIIDAVLAELHPLTQRWGDRFAKTIVVDTPNNLARIRARLAARMRRKGIEPIFQPTTAAPASVPGS